MKKEDFTLLLQDLYKLYNPSFAEHIPMLVERYSRMEVDAVKTALMKYNRKNASFYDPEKDKEEYAINLVNEYSKGNRVLYGAVLEPLKVEQVKAEDTSEKIDSKINEIKSELSQRETELVKSYENKLKELSSQLNNVAKQKTSLYENVDVRLVVNYTEHELKIPKKEIILSLGVGARIITTSVDGSHIIALKIVDILCDGVSDMEGKLIIEIILDRE
jgi:hypothetical protein